MEKTNGTQLRFFAMLDSLLTEQELQDLRDGDAVYEDFIDCTRKEYREVGDDGYLHETASVCFSRDLNTFEETRSEDYWAQMGDFDNAAGGACSELSDGKSYDYGAMVRAVKSLGRPLSEEEGEAYRMGSTVQHVFARADVAGVVAAYLLTATKTHDADTHPIQVRMLGLDEMILTIRDTVECVRQCTPDTLDDPRTIFVIEDDNYGWDEREQAGWNCFSVRDLEAREKLSAPITGLPDQWALCGKTIEQLAGMKLAWPSEEKYGTEACCAIILGALFAYGYPADDRVNCNGWQLEKYWGAVPDSEERYAKPTSEFNYAHYERMLRQEYGRYLADAQEHRDWI